MKKLNKMRRKTILEKERKLEGQNKIEMRKKCVKNL